MILGLAMFIGGHTFVTFRDQRAAVIARMGEKSYKGLFGLLSIIAVILIGYGFAQYRATGWVDLWYPPRWTRYVAEAMMWPACVCVFAAYFPGDIKRWLKHPLLVAVKLWAVAHLITNGDLGSIILFGSLLAWAVFDRITLKYRTDAGALAFPTGGRGNDIMAVVLGTLLYVILGYWFHPYVVGVRVFAR